MSIIRPILHLGKLRHRKVRVYQDPRVHATMKMGMWKIYRISYLLKFYLKTGKKLKRTVQAMEKEYDLGPADFLD